MLRHTPDKRVADGIQVCPPVMIHYPLWVARRPRRVIQTDCPPLVHRPIPPELGVPPPEQLLVLGVPTYAVGWPVGGPHDVSGGVVDHNNKRPKPFIGFRGMGYCVFSDTQELPAETGYGKRIS